VVILQITEEMPESQRCILQIKLLVLNIMLADQMPGGATACENLFSFPVTSLYDLGFKESDREVWDVLQLADAVDIYVGVPDEFFVDRVVLRLKSEDLKRNIQKLLIV
jgi:hypothetical protein